jgi:hypothetical protein
MKWLLRPAIYIAAATLWSIPLSAQQPDTTARRKLDSLTAVIRALETRVDSLRRGGGAAAAAPAQDELAALRAAASAASADSTNTSRPQQARLGQNALNPEISVTGDIRGHIFHNAEQTDNFVPRELEMGFQSALDPFATAKVFVSLEGGEVSLEEGYAYFPVLPGHVRLDVGQFRQQVGELNRWHLHALPEDEYPLVVREYAGEEGLVAAGASLYWPLPISGGAGAYELTVQGTSGGNEVLVLGSHHPSVNGQLAGFWQLSRSTFMQLSASGLYGTNPDEGLKTKLGVAAARFTWRPPQQGQARELTVRGELWALRRDFDERVEEPNATRLGGYADATWKLNRRWTVSMRGDYVQTPELGPVAHEWAATPSLTFWQSEFVYVRALYENLNDFASNTTGRFTLQVVFAMGPHKHELF